MRTNFRRRVKWLILLGGVYCLPGEAQILTPTVLSSSGDYFVSANYSLSWTLGESITETLKSSNNTLTQGFQQSSYMVTAVSELPSQVFSVRVYPNPASEFLNVSTEANENMKADIFDINGKLIHSECFQRNAQISLGGYSEGIYLIKLSDEKNNSVQTFKLQKIN